MVINGIEVVIPEGTDMVELGIRALAVFDAACDAPSEDLPQDDVSVAEPIPSDLPMRELIPA